jgi:hypothetical protein
MTEIRKHMDGTWESDYKVGIMAQWELNKEVTDAFLDAIWEASTAILPGLEVQVVIDSANRLHISSGTAGYVDFKINPIGMKQAIVLGKNQRGYWYDFFRDHNWMWENQYRQILYNDNREDMTEILRRVEEE